MHLHSTKKETVLKISMFFSRSITGITTRLTNSYVHHAIYTHHT